MNTNPATTTKPTPFRIDSSSENMFYNSKDLQEYDPVFYYGCKTKPRKIIAKKNIPVADYLFANLKKGEWNISSDDCKKSQLLISRAWVDANMKSMFESRADQPEHEPATSCTADYEEAPSVLELEDAEKFRDADGNIVEIETRGERNRNKIFFKVKHVMTAFSMPNLSCTLRDERNQYKTKVHYTTFFVRSKPVENMPDTIIKEQYLTYKGLLRVLFASNSSGAEQFQDWAEDKLFTIQMGQKEDKIKLGTDILNITTKTYKAVFSAYANKFPCIYLLQLGKVSELRETFNISHDIDDHLHVYKYGFTDDLSRRIGEHERDYGKLNNVSIKLATFHTIDTKYTSDAEGDVRDLVNTFQKKLHFDGHKELILLNQKEVDFVKKQYSYLGTIYAGATAELQKQIAELKDKIKDLEHELENIKLEHNLALQKEQYEKQFLQFQLDNTTQFAALKEEKYILQIQLLQPK
jgi:predicted GIY-YIG superfamily endonuclease